MKKWVYGFMVCALVIAGGLCARMAFADATPVKSYVISELVTEINKAIAILNGVLDSSNNLTSTEVTVDGKYAVTGGDATTGLMVQKAAITATAQTLQTNSFAVAFGAAPTVVCTYTEDPGDVRPIFVTTVTASNFIASVTADKNFAYVAVGTRP